MNLALFWDYLTSLFETTTFPNPFLNWRGNSMKLSFFFV